MKNKTIITMLLLFLFTPVIIKAESMKAIDYIEKIATDNNANKNSVEIIGDTGLAYDGTIDNNLRYVGANPNNYVLFNGEKWRIIGVMNNIEDAKGNKGTYLKIIRGESIGAYSWDTSPGYCDSANITGPNGEKIYNCVSWSVNTGLGINEWSTSDIMKLLNPGFESNRERTSIELEKINNVRQFEYFDDRLINNSLYWNSGKGKCFNYYNNGEVDCDFSDTGMKEESKKFIAIVKWNTGSNGPEGYGNYHFIDFYNSERSNNSGKHCEADEMNYDGVLVYCNDTVEHTTTWVGKVGLPYVSDVIFATNGSDNFTREQCQYEYPVGKWSWDENVSSYRPAYCSQYNWLGMIDYDIVSSMIPNPCYYKGETGDDTFVTYITNGVIDDDLVGYPHDNFPVVYLEQNVLITGGEGTIDNPYRIAFKEEESIILKITSKSNINELFEGLDDTDVNWIIEDKSILKIENGVIIPLKIGTTKVLGEKDGVQYGLTVNVIDVMVINPETKDYVVLLLIVLLITGTVTMLFYKKKQLY